MIIEYPTDLLADVKKATAGRRLTGFTPGQGPRHPELMLIGEAPGRHEEQVNIPFSGASGQELMKLVESIGYSRQTVYITSVVRQRPYSIKRVRDKKTGQVVEKTPNRTPTKGRCGPSHRSSTGSCTTLTRRCWCRWAIRPSSACSVLRLILASCTARRSRRQFRRRTRPGKDTGGASASTGSFRCTTRRPFSTPGVSSPPLRPTGNAWGSSCIICIVKKTNKAIYFWPFCRYNIEIDSETSCLQGVFLVLWINGRMSFC